MNIADVYDMKMMLNMNDVVSSGLIRFGLPLLVLVPLAGCNQQPSGHTVETMSGAPIVRHHDPAKVAEGEKIYRQNCARCHGANAEGDPQWRQPGPDGTYPPPPLNGTGHAWHHPRAWLEQMIHEGSPPGQGNMPPWKDKLTDTEIDAVVEWFQSKWPDQVYGAWFEMQQNTRR